MSYDNLGSISQNVLKFYQQLTGEERRIPFIFDDFHFCRFRGHIKSNNSGTAKVKIVKNERDPLLFTVKLLIKFQNILKNTTQVIIRHRVIIGELLKQADLYISEVSYIIRDFYTPRNKVVGGYTGFTMSDRL
jgi:hypothetical protein